MISSIIFSIVETRSDVAFVTLVASCFAKNPDYQYTKAMKTILWYLKRSRDWSITYRGKNQLFIEGYSNFDQTGDKKSRKLSLSFIFMLNGELVSWYSKRQPIVALSSIETEYIALILAVKDVIWLQLLLTKLGLL